MSRGRSIFPHTVVTSYKIDIIKMLIFTTQNNRIHLIITFITLFLHGYKQIINLSSLSLWKILTSGRRALGQYFLRETGFSANNYGHSRLQLFTFPYILIIRKQMQILGKNDIKTFTQIFWSLRISMSLLYPFLSLNQAKFSTFSRLVIILI